MGIKEKRVAAVGHVVLRAALANGQGGPPDTTPASALGAVVLRVFPIGTRFGPLLDSGGVCSAGPYVVFGM